MEQKSVNFPSLRYFLGIRAYKLYKLKKYAFIIFRNACLIALMLGVLVYWMAFAAWLPDEEDID